MQTPWQDKVLQVTFCMGVATWPNVPASAAEEIVSSADACLYHAKDSGRNRLSMQHGERQLSPAELFDALGLDS